MDDQTALEILSPLLDKVSISRAQHIALEHFLGIKALPKEWYGEDARSSLSSLLDSPRLSEDQHKAIHYFLDPIPVKTRVIKGAGAKDEKANTVAQGRSIWERLTKDERESLQAFMGEMKTMTFPDDNGAFMTNRG